MKAERQSRPSREIGIRDTTIYGWVSRYKENSEKPFVGSGHIKPEDEAYKKLLKENKELKEENEILKKAAAYFAKNQCARKWNIKTRL